MSHFSANLLAGEVAIITGGGTGIGYGIALSFAKHGAKVVIASRKKDILEAAAADIRKESRGTCIAIPCDIRKQDDVDALVSKTLKEFGKIDILVNNAAGNFPSPAESLTPNAFSTVVAIDLTGTFLMTRAVIAHMIEKKKGAILSIVTVDPHRGFPMFSHAGAAKAGIVSLTSSWAVEWGQHNIRVNAIGPGPVATEGVARQLLGHKGDNWIAAFDPLAKHIPLGRVGVVSDIANAALFLCSPASSWVSGVNLTVDGAGGLPHAPVPRPSKL